MGNENCCLDGDQENSSYETDSEAETCQILEDLFAKANYKKPLSF